MANILDKFKTTSIGSSGRVLDFSSKLSPSGDFNKLFDMDAILTSWSNILMTPRGSMDHDPEFGSDLYLYIFEPADTVTQESIKNEIYKAITTYDDRANIDEINVSFFKNKKGFNISIIANYEGDHSEMNLTMDENTYMSFS
ncbi:MAG TPA: GPW/gp25 family protein [Bacilli bacterium]|nr:GPW/gp25 family protein [Bacilli bacterium]